MDGCLIYLGFESYGSGVHGLVAKNIAPPMILKARRQEHRQFDAIIDLIDNNHKTRRFPMNAMGTPFQEQVWTQLLHIPFGKTWTYKQLAEAAGVPGSYRAVANACAANPIAVLIPCHRVTQTNGALGGYHWGTEIKSQLLELEAQQAEEMEHACLSLAPKVIREESSRPH
jgi:O-6-methylguanine DNA methyltransferase